MMSTNNCEDEIMTITEVAQYLKISEVTTYKFVQGGKISGFKIGRHWRVKRCDLDEFIEKQKCGQNL